VENDNFRLFTEAKPLKQLLTRESSVTVDHMMLRVTWNVVKCCIPVSEIAFEKAYSNTVGE